jgi:hypothetical protein
MSRDRKDLGHISSTTDWDRKEKNRAEIEAERAADPWPWLEELHAWSYQNSTPEVRAHRRRWDPPPSHSHRGKS